MDGDKQHPFDWGEVVHVDQQAPEPFYPGVKGWVVGFVYVDSAKLVEQYEVEPGTILCIVEFEDLEDRVIPSRYLHAS